MPDGGQNGVKREDHNDEQVLAEKERYISAHIKYSTNSRSGFDCENLITVNCEFSRARNQ